MLKLNLHLSGVYRCRRVSIGLIVSCETAKRKLPVMSENLQILTISHKKINRKKLSFKTNRERNLPLQLILKIHLPTKPYCSVLQL